MLDQESDKTIMRRTRRALDTDRDFIDVVAVLVTKVETAWLREIDLVRSERELAPDNTPHLDVDFRPVKRRLIGHLDIINAGMFQYVPRHFFGLFPKFRFVDKLLPPFGRIMGRETHQIFLDPKELEIFQIHLVYCIEFPFK